jgi:hypothetical protein
MGDISRELIDELRDRIGFLERQLETEQAASAELRRIVAGLVQCVPELEAPPESRETPEPRSEGPTPTEDATASEEQPQRRSWLHRFFFRPKR